MKTTQGVSGGNRDALMRARVRKQANRASRPVLVGQELIDHVARQEAELAAWQRGEEERRREGMRRPSRYDGGWY